MISTVTREEAFYANNDVESIVLLVEVKVKEERERCASLCRQQAERSVGDWLVPEASREIEKAILEGWKDLEE